MNHLSEHSDPLPTYAYTAVQNDHIRIIEVLPGRGDDPVFCLIHEVSLNDNPHYEALSYVWGDPPALVSCVYIVDSATTDGGLEDSSGVNEDHKKPCFLPVTATLRCALIRLRHPEHSRRLWVDAVCINQKNLHEQASQVGMMTKIFSQAARVVAHLGYEETGSEMLPSTLQKIREHDAYRRKNGQSNMNHFWDEIQMPRENVEVWEAIRNFFDRPWYD